MFCPQTKKIWRQVIKDWSSGFCQGSPSVGWKRISRHTVFQKGVSLLRAGSRDNEGAANASGWLPDRPGRANRMLLEQRLAQERAEAFFVGCLLSRFSPLWLFVTLWIVAHQVSLSTGFFRQEYWSGLPCPPPGDLPDPGIEPTSLMSPALAGRFSTTSATWKALSQVSSQFL